jgi:hypothetical protein
MTLPWGDTKILLRGIPCKDVAHQLAQLARSLVVLHSGLFDFDSIVRKIWYIQVYQQLSAIRVRVSPHSSIPFRSQCCQFRDETSLLVKKLFWPVAAHPLFKYFQVTRVCLHIRYRYLMRAERPSTGMPSTSFGPVHPLGVRRMMAGQRGSFVEPRVRASSWYERILA